MRHGLAFVLATLLAVGAHMLTFQASLSAAGPTVDATVATISAGSLAANIGIQGIALNADRLLLYVAEGGRFTLWTAANGCARPSEPLLQLAGGRFRSTLEAAVPIRTGIAPKPLMIRRINGELRSAGLMLQLPQQLLKPALSMNGPH